MTPELEAAIERLGQRADSRHSDRWAEVLEITAILSATPPRTPLRKEAQRAIAERTRIRIRTQQQFCQIVEVCTDEGTGEITLPLRVDYSTALLLVQHGADADVMAEADVNGWTRAQARAWAVGRTVTSDKAPTLWAAVTRAVPRELRKRTDAISGQELYSLLATVKEAAKCFGNQ